MKFGINTLLWTASFDKTHVHLLPQLKEHGFDGVEIARFEWSGFPAAEIRREVEKNGLQAIVCTALTGEQSLISSDAEIRRKTREFLLAAIQSTAELGGDTLVGPFCSAVGFLPGWRPTEDEWERAVEGLRSLTDALDQYKVTLAVEPLNRFETYFLNTTADTVRLCEKVGHDRVGILFDTFHANMEEKNIAEALRSGGKHIRHIHTCENDRGTPGSGHVDWPGVFEAIRDLGYKDWGVIESFGANVPEIAQAARIWRDLAPSVEAIAFDGVEFLRRSAAAASV